MGVAKKERWARENGRDPDPCHRRHGAHRVVGSGPILRLASSARGRESGHAYDAHEFHVAPTALRSPAQRRIAIADPRAAEWRGRQQRPRPVAGGRMMTSRPDPRGDRPPVFTTRSASRPRPVQGPVGVSPDMVGVEDTEVLRRRPLPDDGRSAGRHRGRRSRDSGLVGLDPQDGSSPPSTVRAAGADRW